MWEQAGGELETLAVLPNERGRGMGRALLEAVSRRLRSTGAGEISLDLLVGNDEAGRFYTREGFRLFGVCMTKSLYAHLDLREHRALPRCSEPVWRALVAPAMATCRSPWAFRA